MTCHTTLTFGCSTCIDRVRTDQRPGWYAEMSDDELWHHWGTEDDTRWLRIIGGILVERSVITVETYEDVINDSIVAAS